MTTMAPPPVESHPRPARTPAPRRRIVTLVGVTLGALLVTALLNCDDLVRVAKRMQFGTQRTVAVRLADLNRDVAHALWLDRPRRALDRLFGHDHQAVTPPAPTPVTPVTPAPSPTTTGGPGGGRQRPTPAHPLRVYLGGDSVAEQVGAALAADAVASKVVRVDASARISTGLTRPDYFDWPGRLREVVNAKNPPQVVVVMFGANDIQAIMTPSGPAAVGTQKWLTEYRARVAATMAMLATTQRDIIWVGQPLMRSATFTTRMNEIDAIFASEAHRYRNVRFLDTRPLLADAHGHYAAYLPDRSGEMQLVRASDGVHLSTAGAQRVAHAVMAILSSTWHFETAG